MIKEEAIEKINDLAGGGTAFLFMVDFEMENFRVHRLDAMPDDILYNFRGRTNASRQVQIKNIALHPEPSSFEAYRQGFNLVSDEINYGNSFLTNLTSKTCIHPTAGLEDIFYNSVAPYKIYVRDRFVVFSPECFVRIREDKISSFPMKGTIDASVPDAERLILEDEKEKAEHNTIVDLIRNDLNMVSRNVRVEKFRYVERIKSADSEILQVSSQITGILPENYRSSLGDILFRLLPAGSISGAPKKKTVEIIRSAEKQPRGYYTGICGIFDGNGLDSCVMIRYIEKEGGHYYYRSGGGITFMSKAENEFREIRQKIYVPTS